MVRVLYLGLGLGLGLGSWLEFALGKDEIVGRVIGLWLGLGFHI